MSTFSSSRLPAQFDDDLSFDRPAPQDRRPVRSAPNQWDARDIPGERSLIVAAPTPRSAARLDSVSRGVGLMVKLTALLVLLAMLWGVVSLVGMSARTPAAIGEQIRTAIERGASAVGAAGQSVTDSFDPAHPPRQVLAQDIEIDELLRLAVGADMPGSANRTVRIASIQRRSEASGPDASIYAVLHSELRQPQTSTVLGVTVRTTRDPQDHYLYKGETIRIGKTLYKVNWVSMERQQVALVAYREQDRVSAPLKAEID